MTGTPTSGHRGASARAAVLNGPRYRQMLAILLECSDPVPLETLAKRLTEQDDTDAIQADLHHRCLPKLEAVGWVTRRQEGVTTTAQCPLRAGQASALDDHEDRFWDALGTVLARPRRREIVSLIAHEDQSLAIDRLATRLERRGDSSPRIDQCENRSDILTALYHVDIPQLADAGLIEYHAEQVAPTEFAQTFLDSEVSEIDGLFED